jgi:hypothetical protein
VLFVFILQTDEWCVHNRLFNVNLIIEIFNLNEINQQIVITTKTKTKKKTFVGTLLSPFNLHYIMNFFNRYFEKPLHIPKIYRVFLKYVR